MTEQTQAEKLATEMLDKFFDADGEIHLHSIIVEAISKATAELQAENERIERLIYVPGLLRCAKCGFRLVSTNLQVATGKVAANNNPSDCLNGCGPMWRVSEREAGNEVLDQYDKLQSENERLEISKSFADRQLAQSEAQLELKSNLYEIAKTERDQAQAQVGNLNAAIELATAKLFDADKRALNAEAQVAALVEALKFYSYEFDPALTDTQATAEAYTAKVQREATPDDIKAVVRAAVNLMTSSDVSLKGVMHPLEIELDDAVEALSPESLKMIEEPTK